MLLKTVIVCIIAGLGAGMSTGFAGLSAAVFITPMLVTFLDVPAYQAVGIALASDVLASAISAYTYHKHKNTDLKRGFPLMTAVIAFTLIGSGVAFFISVAEMGNSALGYWSIIVSLGLGISFLLTGKKERTAVKLPDNKGKRLLIILAVGAYIGFNCGFQGAGGGMMLLFALTVVMGFDFKPAVGTSVFIMTFTALIGAVVHFWVDGSMPDTLILLLCIALTTFFARVGAVIANKVSQLTLKKITGILLTVSGLVMLAVKLLER